MFGPKWENFAPIKCTKKIIPTLLNCFQTVALNKELFLPERRKKQQIPKALIRSRL